MFRCPFSFRSIHGHHWSLPVFTPAGQAGWPPRPQSRFAGAVDESSFTRVGPIQVEPPFSDLKKKTSAFVLSRVPLRLSSITR